MPTRVHCKLCEVGTNPRITGMCPAPRWRRVTTPKSSACDAHLSVHAICHQIRQVLVTWQKPEANGHTPDGRSVDAAIHLMAIQVRPVVFHNTAVRARRLNGKQSRTGVATKVEVLLGSARCHFNDLAISKIQAEGNIDGAAEGDPAIGTSIDRWGLAVPVVLRTACR